VIPSKEGGNMGFRRWRGGGAVSGAAAMATTLFLSRAIRCKRICSALALRGLRVALDGMFSIYAQRMDAK